MVIGFRLFIEIFACLARNDGNNETMRKTCCRMGDISLAGQVFHFDILLVDTGFMC